MADKPRLLVLSYNCQARSKLKKQLASPQLSGFTIEHVATEDDALTNLSEDFWQAVLIYGYGADAGFYNTAKVALEHGSKVLFVYKEMSPGVDNIFTCAEAYFLQNPEEYLAMICTA